MTNFNLNVGGIVGGLLALGLLIGALVLTQGEYMKAIVKIGIFGVIVFSAGGNWLWGSFSSQPEDVNPNAPPPPTQPPNYQ